MNNAYSLLLGASIFAACSDSKDTHNNNTALKYPEDTSSDSTAVKKSMKGFDLFLWRVNGKTMYSLLPGTNRQKDPAEIYDPNTAFGLDAIKKQVDNIAPGEYVFIKPNKVGAEEVNELKTYLEKKGLIVTVSFY